MPRTLLAAVPACLLALALAAPALAGNGGFGPVPPASPNAERTSDAYWLIAVFAVGVLLLVVVPLLLFVARYRNRTGDRTLEGPQVHGNTSFELAWTAVPVLILVVVAGFVFYKLPGITDPATAGERAGALRVRVEGRQFYWQYVYPNGAIAIDTLRVPAGRLVELEITAPDADVIHSFWVPALFGKRDAVPGQTTELRFVARRPGTYEGKCGEFCGIQHAAMLASAEVLPAEEFDGWLDEQASAQDAGESDLGRQEWEGVCLKCHRLDEEFIGPALGDNPTLTDVEALGTLVREGRGAMPAVGQGWSDEQIEALAKYLEQLAGDGEEEEGGEDGA